MALSSQSELPAFFSPRQVNIKISHRILPNTQQFRKMTFREWPIPRRWLTENGQIPEDDFREWQNAGRWLTVLRMAKSWKMTYREWPNPGRWLTENGQIPEYDLPRMVKLGRWLTEIGKIPATTNRNWPGPVTSVTVIWCHRLVNLLILNRGFDEPAA